MFGIRPTMVSSKNVYLYVKNDVCGSLCGELLCNITHYQTFVNKKIWKKQIFLVARRLYLVSRILNPPLADEHYITGIFSCLFYNADICLAESGLCHSFLPFREGLLQSQDIYRRKHCRESSSVSMRVFFPTGAELPAWKYLQVGLAVSSFSFSITKSYLKSDKSI